MKKLLYVFAAFILAGFSSCAKHDYEPGGSDDYSKNGFRLNYYVNGSSVNSYATVSPEPGEEDINSLYLLFFTASSGGTGEFIEAIDVSDPDGYPITNIGTINVEFGPGSKLNKTTPYNILMVANLDGYLGTGFTSMDEWLASLEGLTQNEVIQGTMLSIKGQAHDEVHNDSEAISQEDIVMSAIISKSAGQSTVDAELIRAVSRFDVTNNASGYTLVSASIWNAFPTTSVWESAFSDFSVDRANRFYGVETDENKIKGGLYAFENYVTGCQQNDKKTTCIIVGLVDDDDPGTVMYYRVNVNASNYGQQLKRNNAYSIKISRVKGAGEYSESDAWSSEEIKLDTSINEWNVDNQGNIQYDGDNILAVPVSSIAFGYEADTRDYTIFTLGEGTLEISKEILPPGITAELDGKILKVSCTASVETREGSIELRFGNLKATITITQTMKANMYLELSQNSVPAFGNQSGQGLAKNIKVISSGAWTATIYNGGFTFVGGSTITTYQGDDGDSFGLTTTNANTAATALYAFVHVTLDEDPEISRTLVLTQMGVGGFDLTPANTSYTFTPEGETYEGSLTNTYVIKVDADNNDQWEVFAVAGEGNFILDDQTAGLNQFSVTASPNTTDQPLSTSYRVRLVNSTSIYKDIVFTQNPHEIMFSAASVDDVPTAGGYSDEIAITSTKGWQASMTSTNNAATFDEVSTSASGVSGDKIKVHFPKLTTPNYTPVATITVSIPGTSVSKTITVNQTKLSGKAISIGTYGTSWGRLDLASGGNYNNYWGRFRDNWANDSYFGPSGVVYTPSRVTYLANGNASISMLDAAPPANQARILNANNALSSSNGNKLAKWLTDYDNTFAFLVCETGSNAWDNLNMAGKSGTTGSSGRSASTARLLNPDVENTKLMQYLLKDGPFTEGSPIALSDVLFYGGNGYNRYVQGWQSTMIPLILDPGNSNRMLIGIDPTLKLFYVGDVMIFGSGSNAAGNWSGSYSTANYKFMNNLIAWITNAAQYGEDFIKDFR